ncbi:hypothetical protein VUR80DRAFT_5296 [Thermomyces stellatus]
MTEICGDHDTCTCWVRRRRTNGQSPHRPLGPRLANEANINTAASPIAPLEASSLLARTPLPGKQHRRQFIADISQGHYQNPKPRRMIPTNVPSCNLVQIDY